MLEDESERADWELVEDSDLGDGKKGKDKTFVKTVSEDSPGLVNAQTRWVWKSTSMERAVCTIVLLSGDKTGFDVKLSR